jgi:hypothetical protein
VNNLHEASTTANVGPVIEPVLPQPRKKRGLYRRTFPGGSAMPAKNFHHATVRNKGDFIEGSHATIELKGVKGVKLTSGKLKKDGKGGPMVAQHYLFDKKHWTPDKAKAWMKEHKKKVISFDAATKEVKESMLESVKMPDFSEAWGKVTGGQKGKKVDEQQVVASSEGDGWTMRDSFEDIRDQVQKALSEEGDFGSYPRIMGTYSDRVYIEAYIPSMDPQQDGERKWFEVYYDFDEEGDVVIGDSTEIIKRTQFLVKEQAEGILNKLFRVTPDALFEALSGVNDLPDSSFGYVEKGEKDSEGKTTPRGLRHYPMKDKNGEWEKGNVVNALVRLRQADKKSSPWMTDAAKAKILKTIKAGYKALELEFPAE